MGRGMRQGIRRGWSRSRLSWREGKEEERRETKGKRRRLWKGGTGGRDSDQERARRRRGEDMKEAEDAHEEQE